MKSFFDDFLRQVYTIQKVENLDFLNKLKLKIKEELVRDELDLIHKNWKLDNLVNYYRL